MAAPIEKMFFYVSVIFSTILVLTGGKSDRKAIVLTEDNWSDMLQGEWMVEFYAPWCPACQALEHTWDAFAGWMDDLDIKVAKVDVTKNPGLSGRFMVFALPTIFHVKDGYFRQYMGPRGENDFTSFVDDKKWQDVETIPWYKSPSSIHMGVLGMFFKLSMIVRSLHTSITEDWGLPPWGSYVLFALITIAAGLFLGLGLVLCCDCLFPPKPPTPREVLEKQISEAEEEEDKNDKDDRSDILDDTASQEPEKSGARKRITKEASE